jgi:hypothetical protein
MARPASDHQGMSGGLVAETAWVLWEVMGVGVVPR